MNGKLRCPATVTESSNLNFYAGRHSARATRHRSFGQGRLLPLRHFAPLGFGQTRLTPSPGPVRQPRKAIRVGANYPIARRLPVQATGLRGRAHAHPARWHSPECAAPAWRRPSTPPPPATAKYADHCVRSRLSACCPPRINDSRHRVTFAAIWDAPRESGSRAVGMTLLRFA
jgi:hypothetical protein